MELETIILENKEEYIVIDTIEIQGSKYIYLGKQQELENNSMENIVIRKLDKKEKYILGLDNREEYKLALEAYISKYNN